MVDAPLGTRYLGRMRKNLRLILSLIICLCALLTLWSAVDPSWYAISFGEYGNWLYDNSQDLSWESMIGKELDFGQVETRRNNWSPAYTGTHEDLTVRFSTPESMQLINIDDYTKRFNFTLKIENTGAVTDTHDITTSQYTYPVKAGLTDSTLSVFYLVIDPQPLADASYYGTYAVPLHFEVFDKDGELLTSNTYSIIAHYREKSRPGNQAVHLFLVEQFPTAEGIDVVYLQQHPYTVLPVGAATFLSTDWKRNTSYRIDISPHPSQGPIFQFVKTDGQGDTIPYKVTIPGVLTASHTQTFTVPVTNRGPSGYWQERIEVGIRDVNYDDKPLKGGHYVSTIVISLFQN